VFGILVEQEAGVKDDSTVSKEEIVKNEAGRG
jgi:hypothetical protein